MIAGGEAVAAPGQRRLRLGGALVSVALVVVAVVLAAQGGGNTGNRVQAVEASPHFVNAGKLRALASSLGHPLYWAGERAGYRLELKQEGDGSVYLRYLPVGVRAGDPRQDFLTVGTYPVAGALAALRRFAERAGASLRHVAGGGVVLPDPSAAGSVYLVYPGSGLQIEVYDPHPGRSLRLIRSGAIRPVG